MRITSMMWSTYPSGPAKSCFRCLIPTIGVLGTNPDIGGPFHMCPKCKPETLKEADEMFKDKLALVTFIPPPVEPAEDLPRVTGNVLRDQIFEGLFS